MTSYKLNTEPARLTIMTLQEEDVQSVYSRILDNTLSLYTTNQTTRITSEQVKMSSSNTMFVFNEKVELAPGELEAVTIGSVLVINQADEACVLNVKWITGEENIENLFTLSHRELKSYIHPRVIQNVIVNEY